MPGLDGMPPDPTMGMGGPGAGGGPPMGAPPMMPPTMPLPKRRGGGKGRKRRSKGRSVRRKK